MDDAAIPNDKWSKEAVELFNQLSEMGNDWKKLYRDISTAPDGSKYFLNSAANDGTIINYAFFHNVKLQCTKAVVEFGLYCRGPAGYVLLVSKFPNVTSIPR